MRVPPLLTEGWMMTTVRNLRSLTICYCLTIFLSAFLLFQVQPLIGKCILPWFGGSPAVWTTCMLFFQVILFLGYAYAHFTSERLTPRQQGYLHLTLMLLAVLTLPITPDVSWKPGPGDNPVLRILGLLTASVGLPYFVLSSTGPLLQSWFSRTHEGESPYRLYSLSNIGSLLALLTYPFVIEPSTSTLTQSVAWSVGFAAFSLMCALVAVLMWNNASNVVRATLAEELAVEQPAPAAGLRWLWFTLAATPSMLLLATTNQVCLDVAVIPFLWIVPLLLYLLTFILCFDSDRWYVRRPYVYGAMVAMALVCWMIRVGAGAGLLAQVTIYFGGMFLCCMVCHGELAKLRPSPRYLTGYFLTISAGGAAGGLFVGLVAPFLFSGYHELQVALVVCLLICFAVMRRGNLQNGEIFPRGVVSAGVILGSLFLASTFYQTRANATAQLPTVRNFYGVLLVGDRPSEYGDERVLLHGRIIHGRQFLSPELSKLPTAYYIEKAGVGLTLQRHAIDRPRRVGLVGLGAGTLAVYAQPHDHFRYYEIDTDVISMAENCFTFLKDSQGTREIIAGDARLSLEYEEPQNYDVLALDAFSGDAIPAHLLTQEAMAAYLRHMQPDGVLAFHISNLHFDLRPVIAGLVDAFGLHARVVTAGGDKTRGAEQSRWVLVSREAASLDYITSDAAPEPFDERRVLWTDDRSNLVEIMKWR